MSVPCFYPHCVKNGDRTLIVPYIDRPGQNVTLPFCEYHTYIVMGGDFKALKTSSGAHELIGPFKEVRVAEQVYAAIQLMQAAKNANDKG